jgi:hypothetical protein
MVSQDLKAKKAWGVTQPWRGVFILAVSLAVSLGIASLWPPEIMQGIPFGCALCVVPVLVIMTLFWKGWPAEQFEQPVRGIVLLILAALLAGIVFIWTKLVIGGGAISPVSNIFMINTVTLVVIGSPLLEFWPFAGRWSKPWAGLGWFILMYAISLILFRTLFNFTALSNEAWYSPRIDPGGQFFAQIPLTIIVMGLPFAYAFLHLQMWPLAGWKQPWRGLVTCATVWALAGLMFYVTVVRLGFGAVEAQVKFGVFGVFGMIIWIMMLETWPGKTLPQPFGGLVKIVPAILLSIGMFYFVRGFAGWVFPDSAALQGDGLYQWMATVALGICFPFFALYTGMFQAWPLPVEKED